MRNEYMSYNKLLYLKNNETTDKHFKKYYKGSTQPVLHSRYTNQKYNKITKKIILVKFEVLAVVSPTIQVSWDVTLYSQVNSQWQRIASQKIWTLKTSLGFPHAPACFSFYHSLIWYCLNSDCCLEGAHSWLGRQPQWSYWTASRCRERYSQDYPVLS